MRRLSRFGGYKWVEPENLHITLAFLGDITHAQASSLDGALSRIGGRPFGIATGRAGGPGGLAAPRVIWLSMAEGARELERLASSVARAAASCGIELEAKKFRPHMTLARVRGEARPLPREIADELASAPQASWTCASFALMRSELSRSGPTYTAIARYDL